MMEDQKEQTPSNLVREKIELDEETMNLIQQTRREVACLTQQERFARAKIHLEDALQYRHPRIDRFDTQQHFIYRFSYQIQTNTIWETLVQAMSFLYMYLLLFDGSNDDWLYHYGSIVGMVIFWIDLLMELLHSSRDKVRKQSKFPEIFYVRVGLLIFLLAELAMMELAVKNDAGRPINPLKVLRGLLPIVYVSEVRRSFEALISAYEQFLVFIVFQCVVVFMFALVGNILIQVPDGTVTDTFTNNYSSLGHMIFIMYVTGSYDAFPDNQLLAFSISQYFEVFFLLFIFLNMFLFSSIPGSLLFDCFIETRSKYILVDQIKMQHSLILAFISLGDRNYEINIQTIINFLHHLYAYQPESVDAVTELCLKINDDGNCSVHVLEFIRIGRILQENPYLKPSPFAGFPLWQSFKSYCKNILPSCECLNHDCVSVLLALLSIFGAMIGVACMVSQDNVLIIIDKVIAFLLLVDVIIRVLSLGIEDYLDGEWTILDLSMILLNLIFSVFVEAHTLSALFKIVRLFRVFPIFKRLFKSQCLSYEFEMFQKFKKLLGTVVIIVPLTARFIPLFLIAYYMLGIFGMEIFYDLSRQTTDTPSIYDGLSNFQSLIYTQFYLVQVLTQAGWSAVAFDYANRAGSSWVFALVFFVFCHMIIVLVLAAVLKGIIWFVFLTVAQQLDAQQRAEKNSQALKRDMDDKVNNIIDVEQNIKATNLFQYDTITKRTLFEAKADSLIMDQIAKKLKNCGNQSSNLNISSKLYKQYEVDPNLVQIELEATGNSFLFSMIRDCAGGSPSLYVKEEVQEQDIEEYMDRLLKAFRINTTKFEYEIQNSQLLKKHLRHKLFAPYLRESKEQNLLESNHISCEEFNQKKTLQFHVFTLHLILNMATKKYTQKSLVLKELTRQGQIDEYHIKNLLSRKLAESSFQVDQDSIVRQMYLEDTNQSFIDKFEAEYFADIFGASFKEINKVTIQPLIHLESTLTYALKKLARSPHINHLEFFKILGQIESNISNCLLKKGSLFKFVYQIQTDKTSWFTIHYNNLNQTKITFLKKGLWVQEDHLQENQIYYGKDIFKTGPELQSEELLAKAAIMKKLYQSYQSLALTITKNDSFFESNPSFHQYDTYLTYINVKGLPRITPRPLEITKIMAVMLTKEQERTDSDQLGYPISDIGIKPPEDLIDFKIDEAQDGTYLKLGRLFDLNDDEITAVEGLPFAYVLNFLCEISDTLKLYAPSFVHQAEKVLNEHIANSIF